MKFAVCTYGGSASMFLANALDTTQGWRVEHEPSSQDQPTAKRLPGVRLRFDSVVGNYGEVNPRLRYLVPHLPVDRWACVEREPGAMLLSALNRHPEWLDDGEMRLVLAVAEVVAFLQFIDGWRNRGKSVFKMEDLTSRAYALENFAAELGIESFDVNRVNLGSRMNEHGREYLRTLYDLPAVVQGIFRPAFADFNSSYYPGAFS